MSWFTKKKGMSRVHSLRELRTKAEKDERYQQVVFDAADFFGRRKQRKWKRAYNELDQELHSLIGEYGEEMGEEHMVDELNRLIERR